ncbi:hypothetical protein RR42_m3741 [Cupriavidus basilensis]|uniref:Uncharacterized protein n=1 Tax=Cupriavidus basilensis TaxID=68895 RepID=A0A0C4YKE4_9BURK|nr:hypothetical protein RR42_m3741 [Cupriavidus basilensis]
MKRRPGACGKGAHAREARKFSRQQAWPAGSAQRPARLQ